VVVAIRSNHPYTRRIVDIGRARCPGTRFVEPGEGAGLLRMSRPSTFHLQWINIGLRTEPRRTVAWRATKLTVLLVLLRARRTKVLWTCHNLSGKGHSSTSRDKLVRTAVMLLSHEVVVLNREAREPVLTEVPRPLRPRVADRLVHVPMPILGLDHGPAMDAEAARRELGIVATQPLLAYLPGANQVDDLERFGCRGDGFDVLSVDRGATGGLRRTPHGWTYFGRPTDAEYGLLICASDAVVLADERALASMTLHTAVAYRRPVIAPSCPAAAELARLGAASTIAGPLGPQSVRDAIDTLRRRTPESIADGFSAFEAAHADEVVGDALEALYCPDRRLPRPGPPPGS
jgi:hypothetical protein